MSEVSNRRKLARLVALPLGAAALTGLVIAALASGRSRGLLGLPWASAPPSAQALIPRALVIQVVVLAMCITRFVFTEFHVMSASLRRALLVAYGYSTVLTLSGLGLTFMDPTQTASLARWVFFGEVVAIPLVAFQGFGFVRLYQGLERRLANERRLSAQFYRRSTTDPLTGLPNRMLFHTLLGQALARGARQGKGVAVLFMDVERFKRVNDSLGHEAGDLVLEEIGQRLRACLRESDAVCRAGGDEFLALVEGASDPQQLAPLLDRLTAALDRPVAVAGQEVVPAVRIGAAFYPKDASDPAALIRNADQAMAATKGEGRNVITYYRSDLMPASAERLVLENDLRRAIRREELFLQYQPVVDSVSQRIVWLEALVRWKHPQRGLISPAEFIPIAEDSGLIVPLDRWVIRRACSQLAEWREMGLNDLRVSVNLSPRDFYRDDLVDAVAQALQENKLPGAALDLEITESALLRKSPEMVRRLERLKALGVSIVIDDFGTGFSSLGYLNHFPIDAIKFDRGLSIEATNNPRAAAIISGVVAIGQSLGLRVVAEGIERPEQLLSLQGLGCNVVQGFLFSRPLSPEGMENLLREQNRSGRIHFAVA